jgi:hypothetical protein
MNHLNFYFRPKSQQQWWIILATIAVSLSIHLLWHFQSGQYLGALIMMTWAFVWLPVLLGYIATFIEWKNKRKKVSTIQRGAALLLAAVINVIFSHMLDSNESAGYVLLFYIFLFVPLQLVLIIIIDFILHFALRWGRNV